MALCQKVVAALLQLTLTFQRSEENIRELSNMAEITAHYRRGPIPFRKPGCMMPKVFTDLKQ